MPRVEDKGGRAGGEVSEGIRSQGREAREEDAVTTSPGKHHHLAHVAIDHAGEVKRQLAAIQAVLAKFAATPAPQAAPAKDPAATANNSIKKGAKRGHKG